MKQQSFIIHGAFMIAIAVYAIIHPLAIAPAQAGVETDWLMSGIFVFIAFMSAVFGFVFPIIQAKQGIQPSPQSGQIKMIVTDACFESIAIYGLVGGFVGMPDWLAYTLMATALFLLLLNTLRVNRWLSGV